MIQNVSLSDERLLPLLTLNISRSAVTAGWLKAFCVLHNKSSLSHVSVIMFHIFTPARTKLQKEVKVRDEFCSGENNLLLIRILQMQQFMFS